MGLTPPKAPIAEEESELSQKLSNLTLQPDSPPVQVPVTTADVEIWKDFLEYRNNRKEWDAWRENDWKEHHPPHIHELFNNWPTLETSRLQLRPLRLSDADDAFRVLSNATAMKYYGTPPHKNLEFTQKQFIDIMLSRFKHRDAVLFVVTLKEEDKYIGHVTAMQFDRFFKFVDLAYIIDREYWGRGIATEAVTQVVNFLVNTMKIHKIRAGFFAKNIASKRVLQKAGFKQEGYLRDNAFLDGVFEDEYLMALLSSDQVSNE